MKKFDPYKVLGVAQEATLDDIKRAWRDLVKVHHPDKSGGNREQFEEVSRAYAILSDSKSRAEYDRDGSVTNEMDTRLLAASQIVYTTIFKIVENPSFAHVDFDYVDLLPMIRETILNAIKEMTASKDDLERKANVYRKLKDRLRIRSEDTNPILLLMMSDNLSKMQQGIDLFDTHIEAHNLAIEVCGSYTYDFETMSFISSNTSPNMTFTNAGGRFYG